MERIHHHIETRHHIRYEARVQFMPFLKDFTKVMTDAEFKKKRYAYQMRYQYGLEGCKLEQKTRSCSQIIKYSNCIGCPLLSVDNLQEVLSLPSYSSLRINEKENLLSSVGKISADSICAKIISLKHLKTDSFESTIHLLQYYVESFSQHLDECNDSSDA
ncbi:DNA primase large subunit-like [Arctopsyche grandis]|uniref:DNA primase large subunit-like n=1 Tax=Arctopsyche grandis TaxID=121162 RepID=UPI00406D8F3D